MRKDICSYTCASALAVIFAASASFAQSGPVITPATDPDGSATVTNSTPSSEIVVTGSRIAGLKTPTPVTAITADQLFKSSPATMASALREIPALANTAGPQTYSGVKYAGASFLNLRGLDPVRTLTLVDGQRFAPTSAIGTVDINMLPSALVKRVELVTGGASAAYGSDAVAGVANIILDNTFTGLKGSAQYGLTDRNDNREKVLSLTGGITFAGGRGHLIASGEYYKNGGVAGDARAWDRQGYALIPNPAGLPNFIVARDIRTPITYGGLITGGQGGTPAANALFKGIMFGPGGTPSAYNYGTLATSGAQSGGDGITTYFKEIERPLERHSIYVRGSYDLSDDLSLYSSLVVGHSLVDFIAGPQQHTGSTGLVIQRDNAYLPNSIRTAMENAGVTSLLFSRDDTEPGISRERHENDIYRGVVGVKGELLGFKVDGHYEHGYDRERTAIYNNEIVSNYTNAIDAVVNPANGNIVCRSTLTNPTNGCQPYDVFGQGSPSAAAQAYVNGVSSQLNKITEDSAALNFSSTIVTLPAGPLAIAFGAEWRREGLDASNDPGSQASIYRLGNFKAFDNSYSIAEGYAEADLPILRNMRFAKSLSLNGAYRITNYSNSGTVGTWKAGFIYEPTSEIRIRATRSHDIRAPNLYELYSAGVRTSASPIDPFKGGAQLQIVNGFITGNANLKPEIANSYTAGIAFNPSWAHRLNVSFDYYNIKIKGVIATVPLQTVLNQCFAGVNLDCGSLTRDANGNLTLFTQRPINYSAVRTSGFDIEVDYSLPVGAGNLSLRAIGNYVPHYVLAAPGLQTIDYAGYVGGISAPALSGIASTPKFSGQILADYSVGALDFSAQGRFVGAGKYFNSNAPKTQDFNHVNAAAYLDLSVDYDLPWIKGVSVYLHVRNVLNSDPVLDPQPGTAFETNTALYDQIGRDYRFGVRFKY